MNLLDRAIAWASPQRGAQRALARARLALADAGAAALRMDAGAGGGHPGDDAGARLPVRRNWAPAPRDANADTLYALRTQRGQSRDLARTHPIAVGAMQTLLDRSVGTGLALVAQPDRQVIGWTEDQATEWRAGTQREFSLWADSAECDIELAGNFYDRQRIVLGAARASGDCFTLLPDVDPGPRRAVMPYRLRLQILEADRIGNPGMGMDTAEVAGGVRCDTTGRPIAYHVYDRHPGAQLALASAVRGAGRWYDVLGARSGRRRILHHWLPARPGQRRGVPWLAPIITLLKDLDTYTDAELKAAVVSAFFTVFVTTGSGNPAPVFAGAEVGDGPAADQIRMGPAAVVGLAAGEDAKFADPKRPNVAFDPFVQAILQQIGMALGIPFELLLKRFNSSYSASRAALLDAWMFFRGQRTWLARSFCQPVYETWLAEAVGSGRVEAPGFFADPLLRWAYCRAEWVGDSQGSIDPKNEVAAYTAAIEGGLLTHERAEWELFGTDFNETLDTKASERRRLDRAGLARQPKPGAAAPVQGAPGSPAVDEGNA